MTYHEIWTSMNDLEQSFTKIGTIEFLTELLQEAVNNNDQKAILQITKALNAFIPIYTMNFDKKFKVAWETTVTPAYMDEINVKDGEDTIEKYQEVRKYFNH